MDEEAKALNAGREKNVEWLYAGYYSLDDKFFYQPYAYTQNCEVKDYIPVSGCIGTPQSISNTSDSQKESAETDIVLSLQKHDKIENCVILFHQVAPPPKNFRGISRDLKTAFDEYVKIRGIPPIATRQVRLQPDYSLSSRYGWIAPNGDFYACRRTQHCELAERLCFSLYGIEGQDGEQVFEKRGWIKITDDSIVTRNVMFLSFVLPNQSQKNTIFDWCQKYNEDVPSLVKDAA